MFQQIINIFYRYPRSAVGKYKRFGGYLKYLEMIRERNRMNAASRDLPALTVDQEGIKIYFLTGKKHFYQTLFCIHSINGATTMPLNYILVDDGSIDDRLYTRIKRQLPGATVISRQSIDERLEKYLPEEKYPNLHRKRRIYPHLKKLTDIHMLPFGGWKLVLDSDMLFFSTPDVLLNWLREPLQPVHMVDCIESYGYSHGLMSSLCGSPLPQLVNVGIIGLNSNDLDWIKIDDWIGRLEEQEGTSYYLEQALTAMIIAGRPSTVLPAAEYIVNPSPGTVLGKKGVLHHYVDISKMGYFKTAWRNFQ